MADIAEIKAFMALTESFLQYAQNGGVANPSATTNQMMQGLFKNWSDTLLMMVQSFWQPQRQYAVNETCLSPSMPPNTIAICTQAGITGSSEPTWPTLVNGTVTDNGVTWKLIEAYPTQLPANGGTADLAKNAEKLGGQLPAYYASAAALDLKAAIVSPTFTGTPKAPTAAAGTNNTQIATTAFVAEAIAAITSQGKIVAYNLAQNGYVKWDIGLILQWGYQKSTQNGTVTVTWPITFPNKAILAWATKFEDNTGYSKYVGCHSLTASTCKVTHEGNGTNLYAIAIGQ